MHKKPVFLAMLVGLLAFGLAGCGDGGSTTSGGGGGTGQEAPSATTMTEGVWYNGNITSTRDKQWFKFIATASTQYEYVKFGTATHLSTQWYDELDNGNISSKSNGGGVYDSNRSPKLTVGSSYKKGKVYYIKVRDDEYSCGTYEIMFSRNSGMNPQ